VGAGSFPHTRPTAPGSARPLAVSCQHERQGHSPPISFSAAEVQELRRETGKVRARSATPCNPWLVARAALRLDPAHPSPSHRQGTKRCSAQAPPAAQMPQTAHGRQRGFNVQASVTWRPRGSTGRMLCPRVQRCPQAAHPRSTLVGLGALSPATPAHVPHRGVTKPQAKASPPCRHQQPAHRARSSSRPRAHQAVGCPAPAQLPRAPLRLGTSQQHTNKVAASTPADLRCNFKPKLFATEITGL